MACAVHTRVMSHPQIHGTSQSTGNTVVSAIITVVAIICVALRFYVRVHMKAGVGADDWWILAGLLSFLLTAGLLLWSTNADPFAECMIRMAIYANATSTFDTSAHTLYLKLSFICTVLYFGVITAIKISILLMYRRLFSINKSFHLQSLLVGMVVVAFGVATTIATIFNCHPLKYNWIGLVPVEHCFNYNVFWMVTGAVEVVIDTVILALPVRMVLGLQVSLRQKASIALVFLLGSFVIITGIIRVVYGYIPRSREPENTKAGLWSTIHLLMGIICACLPTLCPLFPRTTSIVLNTSSAIRRRYYSWTGQYRKDLSRSDSGIGSSTGDAIKISPFKPLECSCGANFKGVRAEIESVAIGIHDCYCGDAIMKDTRVEIETLPMRRPGECYCGAILRDPHAEMVRMNGQRGW